MKRKVKARPIAIVIAMTTAKRERMRVTVKKSGAVATTVDAAEATMGRPTTERPCLHSGGREFFAVFAFPTRVPHQPKLARKPRMA